MENGKLFTPPALNKDRRAYKRDLAPGEPWTFIATDEKQRQGMASAEVGGIMSMWWSTAEPGRLFRVTAVHPGAVETVFLGFQKEPGSFEVADP